MKLVYIAGPFRGANGWEVENNVRRAEETAFEVHSVGAFAVCPHTNTRFFDGTLDDRHWLDGTMILMLRCDAVLFMPRWEKSRGCIAEMEQARIFKLPIFHNVKELEGWLKS